MARVYSATAGLDLVFNDILAGGGSETDVAGLRIREQLRLQTGTDPGKIDVGWGRRVTSVGPSTTTPYDLAGGVTDRDGGVLTFFSTVLIALRNNNTDPLATIEIGPDAVNGHGVLAAGAGYWRASLGAGGGNVATPAISAGTPPGWVSMYCPAGALVVPGVSDVVSTITSAIAGLNDYDLMILGRSI